MEVLQDILHTLRRIVLQDHSLGTRRDEVAGVTWLCATDEFRLTSGIDAIQREFSGEAIVFGPIQVAYRTSFSREVEIDYSHKRQFGSSGEFARVKLRFGPTESGHGVMFRNSIRDDNIPNKFIPGVEKGIREAAEQVGLWGLPFANVEAHLIDGAHHDIDSSTLAFEIAGYTALRDAAQEHYLKLLEPVMRLAVLGPRKHLNAISDDLERSSAQVEKTCMDSHGVIITLTPMRQLIGYSARLDELSEGEARFALTFDHYAVAEGFSTPDGLSAALRV